MRMSSRSLKVNVASTLNITKRPKIEHKRHNRGNLRSFCIVKYDFLFCRFGVFTRMTGFHDVSWCEGYAKAKKARAKFAVGMVHVFCSVMIRDMNLVINLVYCFLWLPVPSGYMRLLQERIERSRLLSARVPGLQISPGTSEWKHLERCGRIRL